MDITDLFGHMEQGDILYLKGRKPQKDAIGFVSDFSRSRYDTPRWVKLSHEPTQKPLFFHQRPKLTRYSITEDAFAGFRLIDPHTWRTKVKDDKHS